MMEINVIPPITNVDRKFPTNRTYNASKDKNLFDLFVVWGLYDNPVAASTQVGHRRNRPVRARDFYLLNKHFKDI